MSASLERGQLLYGRSYFSEAAEQFRQALAEDPENATAKSWLALALVGLKEYSDATRLAEEAIHAAPDEEMSHYAHALVLHARNRFPEALAAIRETVRLGPWDASNFALEAQVHLDLRDWKSCLDAASRGLEVDPEHIGCNNLHSIALTKLGRRDEAAAGMESVLARNPENALSHATQGWNLLHAGKITPALDHFREAMRLDPNDEWARAGIVEAMKARNPIYSVMLRYFLWMSGFSGQVQGMIIFGGFVGNRMLGNFAAANPEWSLWVLPIRIAYGVFVISTWLASPLFNLLLRFDSYGRHALSKDQIHASNWLAATLGLAVAGLIGGAFSGFPMFWIAWAAVFGMLAIPLTSVFTAADGWPRIVMILITTGLFLIGGGAIAAFGVQWLGSAAPFEAKLGAVLFQLFFLGIFVTSLLANFIISRRVKQ